MAQQYQRHRTRTSPIRQWLPLGRFTGRFNQCNPGHCRFLAYYSSSFILQTLFILFLQTSLPLVNISGTSRRTASIHWYFSRGLIQFRTIHSAYVKQRFSKRGVGNSNQRMGFRNSYTASTFLYHLH